MSLGLSPRQGASPFSAEHGDAPFRVLIVDDQAPFRSVAASVIRLVPGWQVAGEAETGEEAVRLSSELHPDLVLMDINLPGISGIEATQRIRGVRADALVVLVSTYALGDLPEEAGRCGALGYVRKDDLTPRLLRSLLTA